MMGRRLVLCLAVGLALPAHTWGDGPEVVDYAAQVRPLLTARCVHCHGATRQEAGLRLDTRSLVLAGGEEGPAVAPGRATESLLIQAITPGDEPPRMPAEGSPLAAAEIALLARWIDQGAPGPDDEPIPPTPAEHWAFVRPVATLPAEAHDWPLGEAVDRLLSAHHQTQSLQPAAPARPEVLLRRVYLDLVGVPPTVDELRAFLADPSPAAYLATVERLLASPLYAERWARHWMDVWRYSDWAGYGAEVRVSQPHIWRWRDWIIESLEADRGYDQMLREMLAGDELAPTEPATLRATGFLARNWYRFNRNVWLDATIEHTGKAFLGLTFNCARCHDHMYDPISQPDYYRLRAFFEPVQVRIDRLPGQPDTAQDGLARVYDDDANAPTHLLIRGNEAQPDQSVAYAASLPETLGLLVARALPAIELVALPPAAHYAGMQDFVQRETLAAAMQRLEQARAAAGESLAAVTAAQARLAALAPAPAAATVVQLENEPTAPPAGPAAEGAESPAGTNSSVESAVANPAEQGDPAVLAAERLAAQIQLDGGERQLVVARAGLSAAQAELAFVAAKQAADRARFADPPSDAWPSLVQAALATQRLAEVAAAERDLAAAELAVRQSDEALAANPDDAALKAAVTKAGEALTAARERKTKALAAQAEAASDFVRSEPIFPPTSTGRRTALAAWITAPENPLTARVAVNHVWLRHLGAPLVENVFDFGMRTPRPPLADVLDWLAVDFNTHGWSQKRLHRQIVCSRAYRRASYDAAANAANAVADADNRYAWRMAARRMEAEVVRDSLLYLGGELDTTRGGADLDQSQGLVTKRRSLYYRHALEKQMTMLALFDAANVEECYRRSESVTPQQGLALANGPLALAEARRLAARLSAPASDDATFVREAFWHVLARGPRAGEAQACLAFLTAQAERLADPARLVPLGEPEPGPVPPAADPRQRARENLVHVLFNHHDFVTIH